MMLSFVALISFFTPPEGWLFTPCKKAEIAFTANVPGSIRPSINYNTEEGSFTLQEYGAIVKKIHTEELHMQWRDLPPITVQGRKGMLAQITASMPQGDLTMLQAIFVEGGKAHILTCCSSAALFPKEEPLFYQAIKSFAFVDHLFALNPAMQEKKEAFYASLEGPYDREEKWKQWQAILADASPALGGHLLYLALQEGRQKIFTSNRSID